MCRDGYTVAAPERRRSRGLTWFGVAVCLAIVAILTGAIPLGSLLARPAPPSAAELSARADLQTHQLQLEEQQARTAKAEADAHAAQVRLDEATTEARWAGVRAVALTVLEVAGMVVGGLAAVLVPVLVAVRRRRRVVPAGIMRFGSVVGGASSRRALPARPVVLDGAALPVREAAGRS